jgi:hypothetical protein
MVTEKEFDAMILLAIILIGFAQFDLSPTPGAVHACDAYIYEMSSHLCAPEEEMPCVQVEITKLECTVIGDEAFIPWTQESGLQPLPGQALNFCIYAHDPIEPGARSDCAVPVLL